MKPQRQSAQYIIEFPITQYYAQNFCRPAMNIRIPTKLTPENTAQSSRGLLEHHTVIVYSHNHLLIPSAWT